MSENYDWNKPINVPEQNERNDFFVFDEGDEVTFEVTEFTKAISSNNNPMAKLELKLSDDEGHEAKCFEKLVLCDKMTWRLKEFLVSIGQAKSDSTTLSPRWNAVKGAKGRCNVEIESYEKDGHPRRINKVAKWLESSTSSAPEKTEQPKKYSF